MAQWSNEPPECKTCSRLKIMLDAARLPVRFTLTAVNEESLQVSKLSQSVCFVQLEPPLVEQYNATCSPLSILSPPFELFPYIILNVSVPEPPAELTAGMVTDRVPEPKKLSASPEKYPLLPLPLPLFWTAPFVTVKPAGTYPSAMLLKFQVCAINKDGTAMIIVNFKIIFFILTYQLGSVGGSGRGTGAGSNKPAAKAP